MKNEGSRRAVKAECLCLVFYKLELKIFREIEITLLEKKVGDLWIQAQKPTKNVNKKLHLYSKF